MFDFEKLTVYQKSKKLNQDILKYLKGNNYLDTFLRDQLKRASISVLLNIAEGSGRFTKPDKKNFYTIARGSVYECVAIIGIIKDENQLSQEQFSGFYSRFEEISKMLLGLINNLLKTN
jgi:four helix bundle protein